VLSCCALAVTGGYVAFFHNARILTFNVVVAVGLAIVTTLRMAREVNVATAAAAFWLIWFLNLSVPLAIRAITRAMGTYAQRSDEDPLTGLLNRRAFIDAVLDRLSSSQPVHTHVAVLMV